jgi:hypothetical protein
VLGGHWSSPWPELNSELRLAVPRNVQGDCQNHFRLGAKIITVHASYLAKVIHMNTMNARLKLLKQKRTSAVIDARRMEAQLTRLTHSRATAGIRTNLVCIVAMFRDYIATLDEAIVISLVELRQLSVLPN